MCRGFIVVPVFFFSFLLVCFFIRGVKVFNHSGAPEPQPCPPPAVPPPPSPPPPPPALLHRQQQQPLLSLGRSDARDNDNNVNNQRARLCPPYYSDLRELVVTLCTHAKNYGKFYLTLM